MVEAFGEEIDPLSFLELEAHLATCADCSSDWRELKAVRQGMEALGKIEGPSELTEARILKAADRKVSTKTKPVASAWWRWMLSPPALAAAMLALIIGVGIFSHQWVQRHPEVKPSMEPALMPRPAEPAKQLMAPPIEDTFTKTKALEEMSAKPALAPSMGGEGGLKRKEIVPVESEKDLSLPATGSFKETLPQAAQPEGVLKQEKLDAQVISQQKKIIAAGKAKIKIKDYQGALADFLQAQKIQDSEELRKLMALCRNELEPSAEKAKEK